jgi:hypothetical protein
MTDLASLPTIAAQPGTAPIAANGTVSGVIGSNATQFTALANTLGPGATSATLPSPAPAIPIATAFQTALASQVQTIVPISQPVSLKPAIIAYPVPAIAAVDLTVRIGMPALQSPRTSLPLPLMTSLVPAPVSARSSTVISVVPASPTSLPVAIASAETPAPPAPEVDLAGPAPGKTVQPAFLLSLISQLPFKSPTPDPDGKLPTAGNILPANPTLARPKAVIQPLADKSDSDRVDSSTDDHALSPVVTSDPSPQPFIALVAAVMQPSPPLTPPRPPVAPTPDAVPAQTTTIAVSNGVRSTPALTVTAITPAAITVAFAPAPSTPTPPLSFAISQAPSSLVGPKPATDAASSITIIQAIPDTATPNSTTPAQPLIVAPTVPTLVPSAPPLHSTVSRLVRQSGMPRAINSNAPTDAGSGSLSPAVGASPVPLDPANPTTSATSPGATPPQDFAALVDRLLEARASAQASTPPQNITATVTHADFGKVSLNFQQDPAGLSVNMTSADPGFARAAQSAIGGFGQAGTVHTIPAGQLLSQQPGNPAPAANQAAAGTTSQGFAQPDSPVPTASSGASSQNSTGFSNASGGSQQSQAQPQQRPGFVPANRSPTVSTSAGSSTGGPAATDQGIFA